MRKFRKIKFQIFRKFRKFTHAQSRRPLQALSLFHQNEPNPAMFLSENFYPLEFPTFYNLPTIFTSLREQTFSIIYARYPGRICIIGSSFTYDTFIKNTWTECWKCIMTLNNTQFLMMLNTNSFQSRNILNYSPVTLEKKWRNHAILENSINSIKVHPKSYTKEN